MQAKKSCFTSKTRTWIWKFWVSTTMFKQKQLWNIDLKFGGGCYMPSRVKVKLCPCLI